METMNVLVNFIKENIYVKKDGVFWGWNKRSKKQVDWLKPFFKREKESTIEEDFIKILKIK